MLRTTRHDKTVCWIKTRPLTPLLAQFRTSTPRNVALFIVYAPYGHGVQGVTDSSAGVIMRSMSVTGMATHVHLRCNCHVQKPTRTRTHDVRTLTDDVRTLTDGVHTLAQTDHTLYFKVSIFCTLEVWLSPPYILHCYADNTFGNPGEGISIPGGTNISLLNSSIYVRCTFCR